MDRGNMAARALGALLVSHLVVPASQGAEESSAAPEIVVTATRSERTVFDAPQAVNVVTQRMIADGNAANLPDALAGESGVLIQKSNTGGGSPFIRGLTGKQVLILVDGVRVNNSYFRFGPHQYLNTIDLNDVSRVEVVHGPASVLYGTDALGGVINVITKRSPYASGAPQSSALLTLRGASADRSTTASARFEHAMGDLALSAGIDLKSFGDLEGGAGVGRQVPSAYDEHSGNFKLRYRLAANQELVFLQQYLRQSDVPKTNEVVLGTKLKFNYEPQSKALTYLEYSATALHAALLDDLKFNLSYNRQREGEEIIDRATSTIETRELTDIGTLGFTGQFSKQVGASHQLTYGFEHYQDRYDTRKRRLDLAAGTSSEVLPGTPDGATYTTSGIFLQDVIDIGGRAQLMPGLRYSRFKAAGEVQGRPLDLAAGKSTASMMGLYRLDGQFNLVGTLSQGYRAPNMEDFFGRVDFVSEIPNADLRPESSLNREIGLKFKSPATSASAHYFVSTYQDLITRVTVATGVRQRQNLRKARISGIELSASHVLNGSWNLRGALATARGEDLDTGKPLQRMPPLNGSAHLRYSASPSLWADLGIVFAARQDRLSPEDLTDPRIPAGGTPGYAVTRLTVGYRPAARQELILSVDNLGDLRYKTHGSGVYGAGRGVVLSYSVGL